MTSPRFDQFFKLEVRIPEAHDYQQRLAGFHVGTGCKPKWPRRLKAEDEQQRTPYHPQIGREDQELVVGGLSIQHEFRPELLSRNNGEGLSNSPVAGQSRHKTQNSNGAYYE
jgi:hypothetical protein